MTEPSAAKARRGLFRAIAVERYRGPVEYAVPHTLPPARPGLVIAAAVIATAILLLWL